MTTEIKGYTIAQVRLGYFFTKFNEIGGINSTTELENATLFDTIPELLFTVRRAHSVNLATAKDWTIIRVTRRYTSTTEYVEV